MNRLVFIFHFLFCFTSSTLFCQVRQTARDELNTVENLKFLNSDINITSFKDLQNQLIILDFFGTWCVPCIKALPNLADMQNRFKNEVKIVLVSNEKEPQLKKFIKSRVDFLFPVVIDVNNQLNDIFQPPSLPYTIVITKNGKIIIVNENEGVTETAIKNWISDSARESLINGIEIKKERNSLIMSTNKKSENNIVQLSQDYLYASKTGEPLNEILSQIKKLDYQRLLSSLTTENDKKAFWINLYNGYTQDALKKDPGQYKNRNTFFKSKKINVSGFLLSPDFIEHSILRHSKIKWSLGYFNKPFPSGNEKQLRVDKVDYRIHFALNCGAKSCPPIAFYNPETLDTQLDIATKSYLSTETEYDKVNNVISLPALMGWFRADFGGKQGMIKILRKYNIIAGVANPKIRFKKYDWTLSLNNYSK